MFTKMSGNLLIVLTICLLSMVCHSHFHEYPGFGLSKSDDFGAGFGWTFSLDLCKKRCLQTPVCQAINYDGFGTCYVITEFGRIEPTTRTGSGIWTTHINSHRSKYV